VQLLSPLDSSRILASARVRPWWVLTALLVVGLPSVASAVEEQPLSPAGYPRIVNGVLTHAYPTTGAMLRGDKDGLTQHLPINPDTARGWCSGTLIGCRTFLVAGHCVEDLFPDETWVYLQHAGLLTVSSVTRHPDFGFPVADVAVLKLGAPVTGIAPMALNLTDPNPFIPAAGTIAGFGSTGGHIDGGLLYAGRVETAACSPILSSDPDSELVCFDFFDPIGPPGDDSNTCYGDSGGPLFLDLGAGPVLAGVTSGGTGSECLNEQAYDANVYTYRDFILAQLGTDSTTTCGGLPPVGDPQVEVLGFDGTLDDSVPSASYTFSVGAGRNSVRVVLNGHHTDEQHRYDFVNMYVKAGPGASATDFDCKADGLSVFAACTFDLPAAATYSVFLQHVAVDVTVAPPGAADAGDYQLTVTIFGGPPPVCGDGNLDFNEQCDDGNTVNGDCCDANCQYEASGSSCPGDVGRGDVCDQAGHCGPPPVCGNGTLDANEQCDDGNTVNGDCCDANCQYEASGSSCPGDGDLCTVGACDGAGHCGFVAAGACDDGDPCTQDSCAAGIGCVNAAVPATGCRVAGKSLLLLKNKADDVRDALTWKWLQGAATSQLDLGVPTSKTDYTLCLYAGTSAASLAIPAGANWQRAGSGYRFMDPTGAPDGVRAALLANGAAGKARVLVAGRGGNLPDALAPPFPMPVTAQLVNDTNGVCFEAVYSSAVTNKRKQFKAKTP